MPKISACIISYNEEKKIEDCLKSLLPVADEIVVVDSLSTDRTREIAARYADKIIEQPFLGYVEQKNLAVEHASHDWVLSLDCDERLDADLTASILAVKGRLDEASAWRMARKTFYVYRWLNYCWYPDYKIRLFDRRQARWGGINLHERVEVSSGEVRTLSGDILHYSFDSLSDHLRTLDHFTEIGAREILASGKRVTVVDPFTHGFWTFFRLLILKRGFMDGFAGFVVSILSGVHAFVKYSKVIVEKRKSSQSQDN